MTNLGNAQPWQIADAGVHEFEHAGRRWRVTVARPQPTSADGTLTRVVYVLDPFGTLGTAVQVARTTHVLSQGLLPGLLIVGVGPASDEFLELSIQRLHDLTPGQPSELTAKAMADAGVTTGGANAFLDLLIDRVAPQVEDRYGGNAADRTIAGWSLGGLAGAHALLTRPRAFRRYLLVSPSLWWGDRALLSAVASLPDDSGPLDVYLGAGEFEESSDDRSWPPVQGAEASTAMAEARMVTNLQAFAAGLRALQRSDVTVHDEVLAGEHHNTVWGAAFSRGLLALHASSYRHGSTRQ